jgi:TPR repeat protein
MKATQVVLTIAAAMLLAPAVVQSQDAMARAQAACDAYDWPEALAWFEVAAEDGDRQAQQTVALMHLYGAQLYAGVERDVGRAKAWMYRAEAQGSTVAKHMLVRLEREPGIDPARLIAAASD